MRLPAVLVPFPAATDNHQFFNARAFEQTGAARLLLQQEAQPETLAAWLLELVQDENARRPMQSALAQWHCPQVAELIAQTILSDLGLAPLAGPASGRAGQGGSVADQTLLRQKLLTQPTK